MRHLIVIPALFTISICGYSQGETDNWLFGSSVSMNFATNPPLVQQGAIPLFAGTACMSDKNGNLLFYSDGWRVYNALNQPMPGSLPNLDGNTVVYGNQCVLAVPYPGHDSLYYLFYIEHSFNTNYTPRLRYAVIDMNAQNGLGDVIQRDVLLLGGDSVCLKMTASLHCNKRDIWLIGHRKNSTDYFSYLITPNGISSTPVFSSCNSINQSHPFNHRGYMKASPMGDKLAASFMGDLDMIELSDFNSQTGVVGNPKKLNVKPSWANAVAGFVDAGPYGLEFSPSGKYLYVGSLYDIGTPTLPAGHLDQFDVSSNTEATIQSSKFFLDSIHYGRFFGMQLANNGQIYITNENNFLHLIQSPEAGASSCNYTRYAINVGSGNYTKRDLPSFLQTYLRFPVITTGNCQFQNISFFIENQSGVSSVIWDFGDPISAANNSSTSFNPTHIFTAEGSYQVQAVLFNSNGCAPDTIHKLVYSGPFKVFLGNDTTLCQGDTLKLQMQIPNSSNLWNNNTIDMILKVTHPGNYWVRVKIGECIASDTIHVSFQSLPVFSLGNDTTVCISQSLLLAPIINPANVSYLWSSGASGNSIIVNTAGQYWLKIMNNQYGCQYSDTITVQFKTLPNYSLGVDTSLCEGNLLALNALVNGASNYLWNTGSSSPNINVAQSGTYWADVTKDQCTYRDSIAVIFKPLPIVNFGGDTTLCEDNSLVLDAGNPGSQYFWQNNSSGQQFNVTSSGQYFVKVTKDGCSSSDTIKVKYDLKPVFTLGPDFGICDGQTILLQPTIQSSSAFQLLWQNGSNAFSFAVTQLGVYSLDVSNYCGSSSDVVNVTKGVCKLYIPSAFTPNGDGKNDIFKAEYGENVTSFNLEIYNRWGQRIFQSRKISDGWDGRLSGTLQPTGVYVWIVIYKELNNTNENVLKGTVTLIR